MCKSATDWDYHWRQDSNGWRKSLNRDPEEKDAVFWDPSQDVLTT